MHSQNILFDGVDLDSHHVVVTVLSHMELYNYYIYITCVVLLGFTEVDEGTIDKENPKEIRLVSHSIGRMSFSAEPKVTKVNFTYILIFYTVHFVHSIYVFAISFTKFFASSFYSFNLPIYSIQKYDTFELNKQRSTQAIK